MNNEPQIPPIIQNLIDGYNRTSNPVWIRENYLSSLERIYKEIGNAINTKQGFKK
jgi:hypothetical protein